MNEYAVLISAIASILVVSITSIISLAINRKTHRQSLSKELHARKITIYEESVATRELITETLQTIHFSLTDILMTSDDTELERLCNSLEPLNARFQAEYNGNRRTVNKSLLYLNDKIDDLHLSGYALNVIRYISEMLVDYHSKKGKENTSVLQEEIKENLGYLNETIGKIQKLNDDHIIKMRKDLDLAKLK